MVSYCTLYKKTNRNIHNFTLEHCFYSAALVAGAIGCNDWWLICIEVGTVVCLSSISTASVLLPCGTGWMALADCKEECHPCNWPSGTYESIPTSKLNCCSTVLLKLTLEIEMLLCFFPDVFLHQYAIHWRIKLQFLLCCNMTHHREQKKTKNCAQVNYMFEMTTLVTLITVKNLLRRHNLS